MENRKHTSLKDLAQALGVSIPTVSRALKDSPEISRELCAKAKALAKEMNYRPNPFAMSLRKNAPRIIGVIVPDIVTHFFASILNGIENMAIANGYFVIITTSHESYEHEKEISRIWSICVWKASLPVCLKKQPISPTSPP